MNPKPVALLIEDEVQIARFIQTSLEKAGWTVHAAHEGQRGLIEAGTRTPDLLILDLGLPDMNGMDIIREVRSWSAMPIIVLSARDAESDKVQALDLGADDYLTKPFGVDELLARVRAALRRIRPATDAAGDSTGTREVFTFGKVAVNWVQRTVTKAGVAVHLTPTEYRLLQVLAQNVGRVLTHRHILKEVWGPAHIDQTHYPRVYIGHLRQKLEDDPTDPQHILTETAVGYRLQC